MSRSTVTVGDVGVEFLGTIVDQYGEPVDVSSATTIELEMHFDSSWGKKTVTGSLKNDGTDGMVTYTTVAGDLAQSGVMEVRWHIVYSGGEFRTARVPYMVDR